MSNYITHFLDSARGVYIPRDFALMIDPQDWTGIDPQDLQTLKDGPDSEFYWDAWESVLNNAESLDGWTLHQDGDLWLVQLDKAISDFNSHCESVLEYEERHWDAGDAYAHCVQEVDVQDVQRQLDEEIMIKDEANGDALGYSWVKKLNLNLHGLSVDQVSEIALDVFNMVPGSVFGPYEDGLVVGAFAVQEIEIEIPGEFLDVIELIEHAVDAYVTGTGRAYTSTDAVWYAVASVQDLQAGIDNTAGESVPSESQESLEPLGIAAE
ncbi:MAG: hypothetical protein GY766_01635 [Herbaspirillum sp.]|uniref:hypothetical protein n=1 Tax=Herbaspirillum sp. TaxID=1890675 RepID=UPI00258B4E68|nr:hypothetical protein [Herbaspirillum sp.]MCP3653588.1 hypothetical protein [Herbaspirillum sp.]